MKICHVITRMIIGGAQENTHLTCAGLAERGHEVMLVTGVETGPEGSLLDDLPPPNYRVQPLPSLRRSPHPLHDWRARREMTRLFREHRFDVVHTHSSKAGILGRLAARAAGVPIIVHTIHGMSFNRTQPGPIRWAYRAAERYCARCTDHIVTVADAMTRQAVAAKLAPPERFTTVYSGMQTEWFTPTAYDRRAVRSAWGFSDEHIVVGTLARLFHNKGYEPLIAAMDIAARRRPELRFVWVGDGPHRERYLAKLAQLGLRDRVHLCGLVPPREVAGLLAGIDMLVHTSRWEGLPRAAVQALLMCCPVISFDIDGAPDVVLPEQTGLLVPLNDIAQLAAAIERLAADPGLRQAFGQNGRTLCLERFDHQRMVVQLEQLYERLLRGPAVR